MNPLRFKKLILLSLLSGVLCRGAELPLLNQMQERHIAIQKRVAPAVVEVESLGKRVKANYYGTGVVISENGLILTSSTAASAQADSVKVSFPNGKVLFASIIASDPGTEICLLRAVPVPGETQKSFAFLELADSEKARVGELAYTGGNPFRTISHDGQVSWSVGTISGIYKLKNADTMAHYSGLVLETDAAVNPGSDGGPLIDSNGRLLGILSMSYCDSRWLGTAIPTHLIKKALASELQNVALHEPGALDKVETGESARAARGVAEGLIVASRQAEKALVKLYVTRPETTPAAKNPDGSPKPMAPAQRIKNRPDAPVTGVIFDPQGFILTSAFNVEGDDDADTPPVIVAQLANGAKLPARRLGRHFGLDVAVLKIEKPKDQELPFIKLEPAPELRLGRCVTVLGWTEEGAATRTMGVVSAVGRLDGGVVQTDALINYGNAGGAVIDLRGHLVGVASQVKPERIWSQINSGVGFFAQSDKILADIGDLMFSRDMREPFSYFAGYEAKQDLKGVKIEKVESGSVAELAKLKVDDVILVVDGMDTPNWPTLVKVLKAHKPGSQIDITCLRDGRRFEAQAVLPGKN